MSQLFILAHDTAKQRAHESIEAPEHEGWVVRVAPPNKSRDQEAKYHAMFGDISDQVTHCGQSFDSETWKRLLIDAFHYETKSDPDYAEDWRKMGSLEFVPALNRAGVVILGMQSRNFPKKLASAFIEWLYAFGTERGVVWKNHYREVV